MNVDIARAAQRLAQDADKMHRLAQAAEVARAQIETWPASPERTLVERVTNDGLARAAAGVIRSTRGLAESMEIRA